MRGTRRVPQHHSGGLPPIGGGRVFIDIPPHKGPVVASISDQDARDLYEFRLPWNAWPSNCLSRAPLMTISPPSCAAAANLFAAHDSGDVPQMISAKNRVLRDFLRRYGKPNRQ